MCIQITRARFLALLLLPSIWTASAAEPANIPNLASGAEPPAVPDFTAGDPIGVTHDWNLGPTGARGWMWGWLLSTDLARQIYVTEVAAGSPAAQANKLQVGDVILGIDGNLFTSDARITLGNAITEAEKTANNGSLSLTRWRSGTTSTVTIALPVKGSYSALSPVSCSKSTAIMDDACQYIVNKGLSSNIQGYMNALGLLSTGDSQYSSTLQTFARSLNPRTAPGNWNWDAAYMNLFLTEYYLATGDTEVLPEIEELCLFLANGQSQVGSWGHLPAMPNEMLGGYGALNSIGLVCAVSLELGRKCGVNEPAVELAVTRAADFFRRFVNCGTIPYGDHAPPQLHDDNGKSSTAAVFYDLIGEVEPTAYYSRMTVASYGLREMGHTGNYWSYIWGPLGAQRSGDEASAAFLREQYWFHDLERRWDGGFVYQGGAGQSGSEHKTPGWDTTGARVLMYALPLKNLYITGKAASSAPELTTAEVDETILSGSDFSYWYALSRLSAEAYDDLSTAELLVRLDTWSCEQRDRAARALSRKASPPISNYRTMIASSDRDTILGGLCGLRYMGTAALPALADVEPLLSHTDIWVQFQAGKVMCAIGASARDTTFPVVFGIASAASEAADPRQFRQRFAAYNLWGNGWLEQSSFGLLRNFNQADLESLLPAVRKTMRHEHSVPRMFLAEWLNGLSFSELEPYWFDIYNAVESQAPTAVMWNHESRNHCLDMLRRHNFKETVDAAATYAETMKNHGAEYRMGEVMDVLVEFGTEAQRVLPRLYAARADYVANWGPGKPYPFPQWAMDDMIAALDAGITAIENASTAPANLKTIYDYSMYVMAPPSATPSTVDVDEPTTLSVAISQGDDLPISYNWNKVSGPGNVNFGSANASETTAIFDAAGIYELQVTAQDAYRTKVLSLQMLVGGALAGELGCLDITANGGINPATGNRWQLGDTYRLVFVSSAGTTAQSTNLATYDTFVQNLATTAGYGDGNWKVIGSSSATDARDHTSTNPNTDGSSEAVILIDGGTIIANNYADLWDGGINAAINVTEQGAGGINASVFTGTYIDGTNNDPDGRTFGGSGESPPKVTTGKSSRTSSHWVRDFNFNASDSMRVYAISNVLQISASYPPVVNAGSDQAVSLISGGVGTPSAGDDIYLNADTHDGTGTWSDARAVWDLTLGAGVTHLARPGSALPGITAAYHFPGGAGGAGGATGATFDGGWDGQPVSIEIWFKPDSTADDGVDSGQILYETGGKTGLGIFYNDGNIQVGHNRTEVISDCDVSDVADEFIQVVLTYDQTNYELYVNGASAASGSKSDADWSGGDAAGLAARGGKHTGGRGDGDAGTESFEGAIAIFRAYNNQVLTPTQVEANYRSVAGGYSASATLNGLVTDSEGGLLAGTWARESGPGPVGFSDPLALDATATFSVAGTYVLSLRADYGGGTISDTVTVTVLVPGPVEYGMWANGSFANALVDKSMGSNPDGDKLSNMMEFAFGTDPTVMDMSPLATDGSRNGEPLLKAAGGGGFDFYFIRRKDYDTVGSLSYTVCFSDDLTSFTESIVGQEATSIDADYELVKVPFPAGKRFGSVRVEEYVAP